MTEIQSLKQRTISSLVWKLLERGGNQIIQLIVQILLARLLAPEEFGILAIMLVFVNIGNVLVQSGLNTALIQAESVTDEDCSTVFWISLLIAIFLFAIVYLAAPYIAIFYGAPTIIWPLRAMMLVLLSGALNSVQIAIVQRTMQFRKVFKATMFSVVTSGVVSILMAIYGFGIWSLVVQQIVYQFVNCLVMFSQVSWRPSIVFKSSQAKTLFSFGWRLLISGLLDQAYISLSDLIIGKQFSKSSLGLVSQGKKYPQALGLMLDGAIQPVMLSAVSRVQDNRTKVKRLVRRALKTSTFLIFPAMTLFAITAEPVVAIILGEKWLPCVPYLQMYCFVYALLPIQTANLQALNGVGRSDLFLRLEIIKKAYGVVFLLLAAFVMHDLQVMVATYMLSGVISTFVNSYPNKRIIGYSYREQLHDIAPAFLIAIIAGSVSFFVGSFFDGFALKIALECVVMVISYMGLSALFKVESLFYLIMTIKEILKK